MCLDTLNEPKVTPVDGGSGSTPGVQIPDYDQGDDGSGTGFSSGGNNDRGSGSNNDGGSGDSGDYPSTISDGKSSGQRSRRSEGKLTLMGDERFAVKIDDSCHHDE